MGWGTYTYRPGESVMIRDKLTGKLRTCVVASVIVSGLPPTGYYVADDGTKFNDDDLYETELYNLGG